jgi:hypothetical protein
MHDPAPTNVTGGQWWLPSCHVRSLSSFHRLTRDSAVALLVRFYVQVSSPCRLPSVPSVSSGHWTQDQGAAPTYRGLRSETVVLRCPVFLIWETAVLGWPWPVLRAMGVLLFFSGELVEGLSQLVVAAWLLTTSWRPHLQRPLCLLPQWTIL